MKYRRLGRLGWEVSEIGFGAWGIGKGMWVGAEDGESRRALHRAIDLGVNFIDTALGYGEGHSERLVGSAVISRKERVFVATKVPPKNREWPARRGTPVEEAFPGEYIVACAETSLRNLGFNAIDLLQLHVWSDDWLGQGDWLEAVDRLKRDGKIRAFGVSVNDHQPESAVELVRSGAVDTVQVIYNVFDQTPGDRLFSLAGEKGVGIIVRVPFDEGALTGRIGPDTTFPEGDFRNRYFRGERKREVFERAGRIAADLGIPLERLPEAALRFALDPSAVSTVVPGMRSISHVEANCAAGDGRGLSEGDREKLRRHRWDKNFYVS